MFLSQLRGSFIAVRALYMALYRLCHFNCYKGKEPILSLEVDTGFYHILSAGKKLWRPLEVVFCPLKEILGGSGRGCGTYYYSLVPSMH